MFKGEDEGKKVLKHGKTSPEMQAEIIFNHKVHKKRWMNDEKSPADGRGYIPNELRGDVEEVAQPKTE